MKDLLSLSHPDSPSVFARRLRQARLWFPLLIIHIVIAFERYMFTIDNPVQNLWWHIAFYALVGSLVTFLTLTWIAHQVYEREYAQRSLAELYEKLQANHALLSTIQNITEQFAIATDIDQVLDTASQGIATATGAMGSAIFFGEKGLTLTHTYGLNDSLITDAKERNNILQKNISQGETQEQRIQTSTFTHIAETRTRTFTILSTDFKLFGGSIHTYYIQPPNAGQKESFAILAAELSAALGAAQGRTRDLFTVFNVDRSIRAEGNLDKLLAKLLQQLMARADAKIGGVYLCEDETLLRLRHCYGTNYKPTSHTIDAREKNDLSILIEKGKPCIRQQLAPNLRQGPILETAGSALCLPLAYEQELLGIVVLAHPEDNHFDSKSLNFLGMLANQVTLAVRNARAYLQSEELAIVEERTRIAREIHDGVAQTLASSALKLDLVERILKQNLASENSPETPKPDSSENNEQANNTQNDLDKALSILQQSKNAIRESIKEVRRSIFALRPVELERHGFVETICHYSQDYGQQNNISVEVGLEPLPALSSKSEAVLFRIFQEAMHNIAKHSKATHVSVYLGTDDQKQAFVSIRDNGVGFDPKHIANRVTTAGGLGVKQMQERIAQRGGIFKIDSTIGKGTHVYVSLPK